MEAKKNIQSPYEAKHVMNFGLLFYAVRDPEGAVLN